VSGSIQVLGAAPKDARRRLGVVFQESCLDPLMTVQETLALHGKLFGLGGHRLNDGIRSLLSRFGLANRSHNRAGTLSGGLKRRLELARALLPGPDLLLLDEPTTGLDPDSRRSFWDHLGEERDRGLTIVLATNDVQEAERECDTVYFLHHGQIIASGSPAELKAGLKHDSVRVECTNGRAAPLSRTVAGWPDVGGVTAAGPVLHITVDDASAFVPRLFQASDGGIHTVTIEPSTLEDAYFQIAGAPLTEREVGDG
jgi:ABC-2 type transport system ATP-binding protein